VLLGQLLTARGKHRAAWREFDAVLALQPEGPEAENTREELRRLHSPALLEGRTPSVRKRTRDSRYAKG
jgi:hypothetical protein